MSLRVVTPPTGTVVSLAEARSQVSIAVDDASYDDQLLPCLAAATEQCEDYHGRAYLTRQLELRLEAWQPEIWLPCPPLQSIDSITYVDPAGVTQALDPSLYQIDEAAAPAPLRPAYGTSWPSIRPQLAAIRILYTAGYGAGAVPPIVQQAIKIVLGDLFEHRESVITGTISTTLKSLTAQHLLGPTRVDPDTVTI